MKSDDQNSKITREEYKGIEYVQIQNLPHEQKVAIQNWIDRDNVFTIMIGSDLVKDCIQYSDYCFWYDQVYKSEKSPNSTSKSAPLKRLLGFAFDNQ